jgi:hypothetical protein
MTRRQEGDSRVRACSRLTIRATAVVLVVACTAGLGSSVARSAPAEGLVLALGFEDGAAQSARDASGLGNDASLSGARFTTEGRFGGAVECDGVDDWLMVAGVDALDYALWARSTGRAPLGRVSGGHYARAVEPLAVGEWSYLAFTFDGELLRLYVDGVPVGERYRRTALVHSAGPLRICGNSFWGHFLDGFVDELRVYDRALSPDELASDATTPIETPAPELCGDRLDNDRDGIIDEGCIGDRAWRDRNRNGIQDAGEPGLAGAAFRRRTSDGTLLASTVSDANGTYYFGNIPAGTYLVETTQPSGFSLTPPDRGGDNTLDSDFTGPTHRTPDFAFPPNGSITRLDAGFEVFLD